MAKGELMDPRLEVFLTEEGMSKIKDVQTHLKERMPEGAKTTALKGAYTGMLDRLLGTHFLLIEIYPIL